MAENGFDRVFEKLKENLSTEGFDISDLNVKDGVFWQKVRRASDIKSLIKKGKSNGSAKSS